MRISGLAALSFIMVVTLNVILFSGTVALAQSSYFSNQGCSGCHVPPAITTCNGCHAHGTHPNNAKNSINIAGAVNKASYAPGETVTVTITGGYRTGWVRAVLFDQNSVELARSTGNDSGMGGSATFPATLSAAAPVTPGNYAWKVAWYGNQYEMSGGLFGPSWTPDPNNPGHGYEIVNIATPFTVVASVPAPTIVSISPNILAQGVTNQSITISGSNLAGAVITFSNPGVTAGTATISSNSITLPLSVATSAAIGAGTLTVTTANGSLSMPFEITAATATPAPAISVVTPNSFIQGAIAQTVSISGANLSGATVSFSNPGIIGGVVSSGANSISLPVSVNANAITGSGTVTVTTAGGSASNTISVTPKSSGPTLVVSTLSDGSFTNNATLNLSGTASSTAGIQSVTINGSAASVMPDGSFSMALPLAIGVNTITVIATDNAGNLKSDIRSIHYDPAAPQLVVSAPADNGTATSSFVTVSGTVNETSTVTVTNNTSPPQSAAITGNQFSTTVNLASGVNTINIIATDLSGNTSTAKRTVNYDTSKLTLVVTNPPQDITTARSTLILMGTVTNSSKEITVSIKMDDQVSTKVVTNGIFRQRLSFSSPKTYIITVTATDASGNNNSITRNVIYNPEEKNEKKENEHDDHDWSRIDQPRK